MIVVDASVLTDVVLGRERANEAVEVEFADQQHQWLHAPELIEPETLSALRRHVEAGLVSERRGMEAVKDLSRTRLLRFPHSPLRERVWELRHSLTAYDASYLALAEGLHEPVLLTGDKALAREARRSLGPERVRLVD